MGRRSRKLRSGRIPEGIIIPDGRLLLAFSGGSDSLFLMHVLSLLAPGRCEALYVDHALRPRSELEAEMRLNRMNAAACGIPLSIVHLPEGLVARTASERGIGIEAAARSLRYDCLRRRAVEGGFDRILTAHHREDQVETVLMRMLQSSPFHAWQGIVEDDGTVFRPILSVPKSAIMRYLEDVGAKWSEDSTNCDPGYLRNSIRLCILPLISEEERSAISSIASNVAAFRRRFPPLADDGGVVSREAFLSSFPFQREDLVYALLSRYGFKGRVPRQVLDAVVRKAEDGRGSLEIGAVSAVFSSDTISFHPRLDDFAMEWKGGQLRFQGLVFGPVEPDSLTLIIDTDRLVPPVVLRTAREGDRVQLKEGAKKLSELGKDMRIPHSIVLEDRRGIEAVFARFAGGRDRLSEAMLSESRKGVALAIRHE